MLFIDRDVARRLERTEGYTCAQYAAARRRLFPDSGAEWIEQAGAYAAFDGRESPITQSFALGLSEPLSEPVLDAFEQFFLTRGARVEHEISPFAGVEALDLLCERGYRPIEVSSMLCRSIAPEAVATWPGASVSPALDIDVRTNDVRTVDVRTVDVRTSDVPAIDVCIIDRRNRRDVDLWRDLCVRGWSSVLPDAQALLHDIGTIAVEREGTWCFLASIDGTPGAAGLLCLHEGVALLGGSTTVPELRRRGLQTALLRARLRHAREAGCELAAIVAAPGSDSQRNAERAGFRLAYTRTKWRLQPA